MEIEVRHYPIDPGLAEAFKTCGVRQEDEYALRGFLNLLFIKGPKVRLHGEHSIRVGLKNVEIANFLGLDPKPALMMGIAHDIGKSGVDPDVLSKTCGWTEEDARVIRPHVLNGYYLLRGKFDFTAEGQVLHHAFQENGYPLELPPLLHDYSGDTQAKILVYARLNAMSDVYDALHRVNSRYGEEPRALTPEEIKGEMFRLNSDWESLVRDCYKAGIFK